MQEKLTQGEEKLSRYYFFSVHQKTAFETVFTILLTNTKKASHDFTMYIFFGKH
jgi:hypothetical protein